MYKNLPPIQRNNFMQFCFVYMVQDAASWIWKLCIALPQV